MSFAASDADGTAKQQRADGDSGTPDQASFTQLTARLADRLQRDHGRPPTTSELRGRLFDVLYEHAEAQIVAADLTATRERVLTVLADRGLLDVLDPNVPLDDHPAPP